VYRVVLLESLLTLIAASGFYLFAGFHSAIAAFYGGLIAIVNAGLVVWYGHRACQLAGTDAGRSLRMVASCATQRLLYTALFFAAGMGPLKLEPLAMLATFILCQILVIIESSRR